MYCFAFGMPVVVGLIAGMKAWTSSAENTSTVTLAAKSFAAAVAPLLIVVAGLMVFSGVMLYLGTFRVGNHVRITGGDHDGKDAVVTKYHGLTTNGWVHVRLANEGLETTVSPYQVRKIGIRSHVL
jgi:hypothetical protein